MRRVPRWLFLFAALPAIAAHAQDYIIDSVRSHAEFDVKVMWLVGIRGDFGSVKGKLSVDLFHGTAMVDAEIDTNNLHMRARSYENWAKSNEFFDSAQFPKIHFVSDSFPIVRMNRGGDLDGMLTLRGIERPVHLTIDAAECADPLHGACAVEAWGSIYRSEFGMQSRRGALSDKVQLRFSAFVDGHDVEKSDPDRGS
jgi:polyisoprenoid-binding protein YceI